MPTLMEQVDPRSQYWQNLADASKKPIRPEYQGLTDPATGQLLSQYALSSPGSLLPGAEDLMSGIQVDSRIMPALTNEALRTGPSAWANLMLQKQGQEEAGARDNSAAQNASNTASAWNQLAMRGGVSGGERERIATAGMRDANASANNVARQGVMDRLSIGTQDETNRLGLLTQLPSLQNQALNPMFQKADFLTKAKESDLSRNLDVNKFNTTSQIQNLQNKNSFDMTAYQEAMKNWAANRQADAQERSGK